MHRKGKNIRLRLFVNLIHRHDRHLKLLAASIGLNLRHLFMSRATRQLGDKRLSPERTTRSVSKVKPDKNLR